MDLLALSWRPSPLFPRDWDSLKNRHPVSKIFPILSFAFPDSPTNKIVTFWDITNQIFSKIQFEILYLISSLYLYHSKHIPFLFSRIR